MRGSLSSDKHTHTKTKAHKKNKMHNFCFVFFFIPPCETKVRIMTNLKETQPHWGAFQLNDILRMSETITCLITWGQSSSGVPISYLSIIVPWSQWGSMLCALTRNSWKRSLLLLRLTVNRRKKWRNVRKREQSTPRPF